MEELIWEKLPRIPGAQKYRFLKNTAGSRDDELCRVHISGACSIPQLSYAPVWMLPPPSHFIIARVFSAVTISKGLMTS